MPRRRIINVSRPVYIQTKRRYGLGMFLFDLFMCFITSGLWLLWMLFRFLRR